MTQEQETTEITEIEKVEDKDIDKEKIKKNKGWDNLRPAKKGEVRNPNGLRGNKTEEQRKAEKLTKEAIKQLVIEYKDTLALALPKIAPALIKKAQSGNVLAIRELKETIMGKAKEQDDGGEKKLPQPIININLIGKDVIRKDDSDHENRIIIKEN